MCCSFDRSYYTVGDDNCCDFIGSTDVEIQAAIDTALINGISEVVIKEGVYNISNTINIPNDSIVIRGNSGAFDTKLESTATLSGRMFEITGNDVTVRDLEFNGDLSTGFDNIKYFNNDSGKVFNITSKNSYLHGIEFEGCTNFSVSKSRFYNCGKTAGGGVSSISMADGENHSFWIGDNYIEGGEGKGIHTKNNCSKGVIRGNAVIGAKYQSIMLGSELSSPGLESYDIKVTDNYIDGLGVGNTSNANADGIHLFYGEGHIVKGNTVKNIANYAYSVNSSRDCLFNSNTGENSERMFYVFNFAENIRVENLIVKGGTVRGILLGGSCDNISFTDCQVTDSEYGFYVGGNVTNIDINNCYAYNNSIHGIRNDANGTKITNCRAYNNGSNGIELKGDRLHIHNNAVFNNTVRGINISGTVINSQIAHNSVYSNSGGDIIGTGGVNTVIIDNY